MVRNERIPLDRCVEVSAAVNTHLVNSNLLVHDLTGAEEVRQWQEASDTVTCPAIHGLAHFALALRDHVLSGPPRVRGERVERAAKSQVKCVDGFAGVALGTTIHPVPHVSRVDRGGWCYTAIHCERCDQTVQSLDLVTPLFSVDILTHTQQNVVREIK